MSVRSLCLVSLTGALTVSVCLGQSQIFPVNAQQPPGVSSSQKPKASTPATTVPRKTFSFVVQGGGEITAIAGSSSGGKRTVVFAPFLEKTDGNLYQAALQSLWNLYGKERGLFQLQDAQMRPNAALGGNAICWRIANPSAHYCIFPTKDSKTDRIGALTVWVE